MFERVKKRLDWVALFVGAAALLSNLCLPYEGCYRCVCDVLCIVAGFACLGYILYAFKLWLGEIPRFDWHLINGHFLRKVCCLVLLMPSMLAGIGMLLVDSSKGLVYDGNLYACGDDELPCAVKCEQESPNIYWSTYYHFIDPGNQHMTTTKGGRAWAAVIAVFGMFLLNGLLVSSIIGYVDRRKEKWIKGEVRYKWFLKRTPHYVIIGGNDMVPGIVKQLLENKKTILIQTARDVEAFRRELFSILNEEEQKRIIIYYGSRTSEKDIKELCIEKAEEVYILGEETRTDDIESYHDTMNMKCLNLILENYKKAHEGRRITEMLLQVEEYRKQLEAAKEQTEKDELRRNNSKLEDGWKNRCRLKCRVMFEYQTTFSVFQFYDVNEGVEAYIEFRPFNYYEMWAQKVFINREWDKMALLKNKNNPEVYLPLEGADGIKRDDESYVHLFIVGMSRMGVSMGVEAAHLAHYPNYETRGIRTKITFIDKNALEEKDFFMGRFKELFALSHWRYGDVKDNGDLVWEKQHAPFDIDYLGGDFLDIEWEFINGGIEQTAIQDYILASAVPSARITIAICLPESNRSHAAALYLHKMIYESESVLQVLVYNRYGNSIVGAIGESGPLFPYIGKLKGFGFSERCIAIDYLRLSEDIGKRIGEAYNESTDINNIVYRGKSKVACLWSNIYNGNTLWTKLRCADFFSSNSIVDGRLVENLADVEHNRWVIEQLLMNFRPLTCDEQEDVVRYKVRNKNTLKSQMAHLDICSNRRLLEIDGNVRKYDIALTKCLFGIHNSL